MSISILAGEHAIQVLHTGFSNEPGLYMVFRAKLHKLVEQYSLFDSSQAYNLAKSLSESGNDVMLTISTERCRVWQMMPSLYPYSSGGSGSETAPIAFLDALAEA